MRKPLCVIGLAVIATMCCPTQTRAAPVSCTVEHVISGDESSGVEESAVIKVQYDDSGNAAYRWRVVDWCLTINEISDFTIPEDIPVLEETVETPEKPNLIWIPMKCTNIVLAMV